MFKYPLYKKQINQLINLLKKKYKTNKTSDIEKIIGCHNGYISKYTKSCKIMHEKWQNELIKCNLIKKNEFIKTYDYFKKRKCNPKSIKSLKDLLKIVNY